MEQVGQRIGELDHGAHVRLTAAVLGEAENAENAQSDHIDHRRGHQHELHVGHHVGACHGRGQVGSLGEGRDLIAEVSTGENGAAGHGRVHAQTQTDAHEGHTHRTHGAPGGARSQRGHGTDQHGGHEEGGGVEDLQAVVDHGRDHTGVEPNTDENADDDQNDEGLQHPLDAVKHEVFHILPPIAQAQGHKGSYQSAHEHGDVGVHFIDQDGGGHEGHQKSQGKQGFPEFWKPGGFRFFFHCSHFLWKNHAMKQEKKQEKIKPVRISSDGFTEK